MDLEHVIEVVKKLFPEEYWVDSIGGNLVRVLDPAGVLALLLPQGTVETILVDVSICHTPLEDYSAAYWESDAQTCFGADVLAKAVAGYLR
jgi:hypothetical protein